MQADTRQPDAPAPRCPRCGYDLAGVVATWTDSCPVGGLCSECGLSFLWADVLRADRQRLSWLYEHAPHWWRADKALGSALRALAPWWFWQRVGVHSAVAPARLVAWPPLCIGALWLIGVLAATVPAAILVTVSRPAAPPSQLLVYPRDGTVAVSFGPRSVTLTKGGTSATVPLPPRNVPIQGDETPLGRVVIFDGPVPANFPLTTVSRVTVGPWPPYPKMTVSVVTVAPAPKPALPDGWGVSYDILVLHAPQPAPPPPMTLRKAVAGVGSLMIYGARRTGVLALPAAVFTHGPMLVPLAFMIPAAVVVLVCPSEWRRAKVRPAHLLRVAAYSLAPTVAMYALFLAGRVGGLGAETAIYYTARPPTSNGSPAARWVDSVAWRLVAAIGNDNTVTLAIVSLWCALYWWFALRRGLALRGSAWLWVFLTVAGLAGVANLLIAHGVW